MEWIDVAVAGGGVAGLATARETASRGLSTCLLERRPRPGQEASTHNSGVLHAGIYYPTGSLKARLCVEGRELLYAFCRRNDIPHARCGKLIVAAEGADLPRLETLAARGHTNGVEDLEIVDPAFLRRREPHVRGVAALWSPSTGIVEAEGIVRTLARLATAAGATLLPGTAVEGGSPIPGGIELHTPRETIRARAVVNAAGLYADEVSSRLGGEAYAIHAVRGEYAELAPAARRLVNGPVYPLPFASGHGLGVHFTPTTWGTVTLGPTARYQPAKDDYESNRLPLDTFLEAARPLVPALRRDDLQPGGTGIRARGAPADQTFCDFRIGCDSHVPRLIHVAGIDSPGLTACLAIGREAADLVEAALDTDG